ncbi:uncharacterized protein UTRI_06004 [Ustilago trichophora]|uniref:Uncharacterized protein n=1 Tax=Ustilago trichophora TaxID=86804 RepID=A0A5C3EJC3_9BASI|nr:uncharacterized protein UTRI_06004 [Ustilago trichophora]
MAGSTVELFSTSILSNVKVRTRHERFTSVLAIKKIPYVYHDLASDDDAKSRWRRKAKDPQLPGILVNNEWVGSYDDFEEAVEFGELELFLGVTPAAASSTPTAPHPAQSAISSKDPSLYPTLPYASEGAGRWKEPDADQFISSLNIKEDELNDADVDALLADIGKLPSELSSSSSEKKYVPSTEAAIKPLRLAKMGPTTSHQRMPSGSPSPSASSATRASPMARYSATQRSTRALAAEAAALTSNRKTSGALLRDAVSQGKNLDDAMEESRMKHIVSEDNIDDLFASLGLSNVDIGDDEVDQFLEQGAIPQGLRLGGDRVHRSTSIADKARDEAVARELALRAKERGHGSARASLSNDSLKLAALQPASQIGSTADDGSTDTLTGSGRTSALSMQVSTITEATSEEPDAKDDESSKTQVTKQAEPEEGESVLKIADQVAVAPSEPDKTSDTAVRSTDTVESETVAQKGLETAAASHNSKVDAVEDDAAETKVGEEQVEAPAASSPHDKLAKTEKADIDEAAEEQSEATAIISSDAQEAGLQQIEPIASSSSTKSLVLEEVEPATLVKAAESEPVLLSTAPEAGSSAVAEPDSSIISVPPTTNDVAKQESTYAELSSSVPRPEIDEDRTPTKEVTEDPIKAESESAAAAAAAAVAKKEPAAVDDDLELELAQAAMIASRFEDRKSAIPSAKESSSSPLDKAETADFATSSSLSSSLNISSPAKSTKASATATSPLRSPLGGEAKKEETNSPLRLGVGATGQSSSSFSRQVSSSSMSSSRRAIDVSRPIDPATSPPPPLPHSSSSDFSTSPETKKKKGLRGFGLGRDKDKDKDKDKETTNDKTTGTSKSGAAMSRHERTISQILREADAVLQSDDFEGGLDNDDDDDGEDPAMFGTESVDIPAVRSS